MKPPKEMLTTSRPRSAAVTNAVRSASPVAEPHHWEIFRATRLTLGAIPLMPVPSRAAAMRPPIQEPWPFQSVVTGPPNSAARSSSETPEHGPADGRVLQAGEVDHPLHLGGQLAVGGTSIHELGDHANPERDVSRGTQPG
jgi:hypothetical protein